MMTLPVYKQNGQVCGEVDLNPHVFGARVNERLLELTMIAYAGRQRLGTHDTKERPDVRGGGKKPWKQKGTGRARVGSRRSPIWRGGGTVFGPHPRDYGADLSEKVKQKALVSALSQKKQEEQIVLLDSLELSSSKTKELSGIIKTLGLEGTKTLFIVNSMDENLKRSSRNLKERFSVRVVRDVNSYHIQRRRKVLIEKQALLTLEKRALGTYSEAGEGAKPS